jgi:hypothetical protein
VNLTVSLDKSSSSRSKGGGGGLSGSTVIAGSGGADGDKTDIPTASDFAAEEEESGTNLSVCCIEEIGSTFVIVISASIAVTISE